MQRREVLELLYDARHRYGSLHCQLSFEIHSRRRSVVRFPNGRLRPFSADEDGSFSAWKSRTEVWLSAPWRMRIEQHNELDGTAYPAVKALRIGDRYWADRRGEPSGTHEPLLGITFGFEFMLDPARLLASFDIEPTASTRWQTRDAVEVLATRRGGTGGIGPAIARGEDDTYRLVVDAQYGVLLEAFKIMGGEYLAHYAVSAIAFGQPLDESLFMIPAHSDAESRVDSREGG